jgi:hypothetical protein
MEGGKMSEESSRGRQGVDLPERVWFHFAQHGKCEKELGLQPRRANYKNQYPFGAFTGLNPVDA